MCILFVSIFIAPRYYDAYLAFFTDYLQHHSPTEALERFIFSPGYNFVSDPEVTKHDSSKHPQMLNRLLAGLIHPFIHLGYGFEFGLLGQVAEGICQKLLRVLSAFLLTLPIVFRFQGWRKLQFIKSPSQNSFHRHIFPHRQPASSCPISHPASLSRRLTVIMYSHPRSVPRLPFTAVSATTPRSVSNCRVYPHSGILLW